MRERLQRFMAGRYGQDELSRAMTYAALALCVVSFIPGLAWVNILALAVIVYSAFRMFSRNSSARYNENQAYRKVMAPVKRRFFILKNQWRDRKTHRVFHCPKCRQRLRVPRGKGSITIHCPKCKTSFVKKT